MKKLLTILYIGFFLLSAKAQSQTPSIKKWKITDLETYIEKSDHPLIINFWATFCVPCVKEIPYFQSTVEAHKQEGIELILVSLDLPDYYPTRIAAFAKKQEYHATLAWLNETDADYFCPRVDKRWTGGIPSSLFVNNKTHYRRFYDRQLTEPQVELAISSLLTPG
jgi:thiol-disulfide isomerase/thioredoxin